MHAKRSFLRASLAAFLVSPIVASAGGFSNTDYDTLTLTSVTTRAETRQVQQNDQPAGLSQAEALALKEPKYFDAAPAGPQIHGFFDSPFKSAYITPRGLVVEDKGLVWQPVAGLVFPAPGFGLQKASVVAGVWNSVNTHQGDPRVGAWNEMDVFVGYGAEIIPNLRFDIDYEAWNFPQSTLGKPSTEHVSQLKFSYDDTALWGGGAFSLHPYLNIFWEWAGSSTVVLGSNGSAGYIEPGIVPTFVLKGKTPLTFTFPTYISIGQEKYWGRGGSALTKSDGNFGVFSTGANVTVPLTFIPPQYGNWHAEAGVLYYHLINDALLRAGNLISGNTDRDKFNAYVGFGVGF
jgi:hypothetical protein